MRRPKSLKITLCALFAALTAVLSQILVPIGPVPINMATFAVFCAGALLGSKLGALSIAIWVLLGAVGVPVYTMMRSGPAALFGPTGGFIIGFMPAAFIIGLIVEKFNGNNKIHIHAIAMLAGATTYFILGTAWFMYSTNTGLLEALGICVFPFIPGDLLKIAAAAMLVMHLRLRLHI